MFSAAKAQFDLALAWSELAMSTFAATTMIANSGAKVLAASAAAEQATRRTESHPTQFFNPWAQPAPQAGMIDPLRFALAATQASAAFWTALLDTPQSASPQPFWMPNFQLAAPRPRKPAAAPLPLWWTAFTDPVMPSVRERKAVTSQPPSPYLH